MINFFASRQIPSQELARKLADEMIDRAKPFAVSPSSVEQDSFEFQIHHTDEIFFDDLVKRNQYLLA